MVIDAWNPETFGADITSALSDRSNLILDYHMEERKLMDEHLSSSPYQSLKPNPLFSAYNQFHEQILAPILAKSRVRVWHYTRLTDGEVDEMHQRLVPSSLGHLRHRLDNLVAKSLLTPEDAEIVFAESPLHKQRNREGRLWTTIVPLPHNDSGVEPLLENWGGESAYFWLSNKRIAATLKSLGRPRIVELETALSDYLNGYRVAETVLRAWAKQMCAPVLLSGCDLSITNCIGTARVMRIHTKGDSCFETIASTYPEGVRVLLEG